MSNKISYKNFSSFILRTPLMPLDFILSIVEKETIPDEELIKICQKPEISEAILVASPGLYQRFNEWVSGNLKKPQKIEDLKYTMMKYILRMSVRPTPYGLFSGISIGNFKEDGEVKLTRRSDYGRHTRLDMNYLCALAQNLARDSKIIEKIRYYPNSSIYRVGNQLRYVEFRYLAAERTHHIVAVDNSGYLQKILKKSKNGAFIDELARELVDDDINFDEAKEFIFELINNQVLVNELEPAITGPEFMDQIIDCLKEVKDIDGTMNLLKKIREKINRMDQQVIGSTIKTYNEISEDLKPFNTEFNLKFLYQTDMVKPTKKCSLNPRVADDLMAGLEFLNKMNGSGIPTSNLNTFRDEFYERYEAREVPLMQVLDTEIGIGYGQTGKTGDLTPLVDNLALPLLSGGDNRGREWSNIQSYLLKKYGEFLADGKKVIELFDDDFKDTRASWENLPDTFSAMIKIIGNPNDLDQEYQMIFSGFGGSSAGNLLGRFCHAHPDVHEYVCQIAAKEREINKDRAIAEIVHLPQARLGNILLRPVLSDYEIPYLAKPYVSREGVIRPDDLMVSVTRERVVLRSKRLNKVVLPRLTSAHNFSFKALPVYQFLADMQTQNIRRGIGFGWGIVGNEFEFCPRVVYKNLIFNEATWNIQTKDIKDIMAIKDPGELLSKVTTWREEKKIPRKIKLMDGDNQLFIDLGNSLCIKTLFSIVKNRGGFQVSEFLFDIQQDSAVNSEDGSFTNEFIISFYKENLEDDEQRNTQT